MNMRLLHRKIKVFWQDHWVLILVIISLIALLILSIMGLMSLESFYRKMTLAQMPITLLLGAVHAAIFVYMYMAVFRGGFAKLGKTQVKAKDVNVTFDDVIGIDESKQEAWEVVELIRDRARVSKIGGKIIKGLLMIGPPGCGKTLLAKAIATEANIPFLSIAGSEFVEIFVGVGASRVRKLFHKARQLAHANGSCIVFIDELDVIGSGRTFSHLGGQETNSTQNQLLAEMDGLGARKENVIVIGATNASESILDSALLRPGRFDRKIYIDRPTLDGREKLFKFYLEKVQYDSSVNIARLARQTVGKSPADIENIIKEAAIIAVREKRELVEHKDLSAAMERIDLGIKHKKSMTKQEREMIAFHETGHLVATYILHPINDVFKASIIARKQTLGVVYHQPREEYYTSSKDKLLADIKVSLGGYASEKLKYNTTSNGVMSDFQHAMGVAHSMVWMWGMADDASLLGDYSSIPKNQISDELKCTLNKETQKIINRCLVEVENLLKKEWQIVERFVKELLEKDELEYDEIESIFREYGKSGYEIGAGSPIAPEPKPKTKK